MKLLLNLTIVILFTATFLNCKSTDAQDNSNCCLEIYNTGLFLGWGNALLEYTQIREAPSPYDKIIYEQLQGASQTLQKAAIACEPYIPAWPNWQQKQSFLANQVSELQAVNKHNFKRKRVYNAINNTYYSWASELSIMMMDGKAIQNTTCATCYFKLGFCTAYASQAFRQAKEAINLNNDPKAAKAQMQLADDFLSRALRVLNTYSEIQQPKGAFIIQCVYLKDLYLEERIKSLIQSSSNINNVESCIQQANSISENIKYEMAGGCGFNSYTTSNANSYDECMSKYCPECNNSIVLLGEAVDTDCQKCLDKYKNLITACMNGESVDEASVDCSQYLNTEPVWDEVNQEFICDCLPGFEWDEDYTKCISQSLSVLQNTDCSMYPNSEAVWDPVSQQAYCDCSPGFQWNEDYTACEQIGQQQVDNNYCSGLPNSYPVFDPVSKRTVCRCLPGYKWNKKQTACIPMTKKPSVNWDNILMTTIGVLNSVNDGNSFPPGSTLGGNSTTSQQAVYHQSDCNSQQQAGANAPEVHTIDLKQTFGSFIFEYETFTEEDQIIVTTGGRTIFDSGCVGQNDKILLNLSGFSSTITVRVNPNCNGGTSTSWNFKVHCPNN